MAYEYRKGVFEPDEKLSEQIREMEEVQARNRQLAEDPFDSDTEHPGEETDDPFGPETEPER